MFRDNLILDANQLVISQVIERRKIPWLCHFTPRNNLENIMKSGLVTRDQLPKNAIITDNYRYDNYNDAICLSISKPNKWLFNKKKEQGYDLCLLLINPCILYIKDCLFYPHNAATASYRNMPYQIFLGEQALENLFANVVTFQKSNRQPTRIERKPDFEDCETTSEQAEVQCLENIESKYIIDIIDDLDNIPLNYRKYIGGLKEDEELIESLLNLLDI